MYPNKCLGKLYITVGILLLFVTLYTSPSFNMPFCIWQEPLQFHAVPDFHCISDIS